MSERKQDIIIVGAGPIGCYCAQLLKKRGFNPLLIEEHSELGKPVHCAGLVGRKVIEEMQLPFPSECILNTVNGGRACLDGQTMALKRKNVAYVIDRAKFDKAMGRHLTIRFGTKCLGIEEDKHCYILETDQGDLKADIIVGADGAASIIRDFVLPHTPESFLKGVQFRIEHRPVQPDIVEIFIDKPYFYWIIPEGESIIRVGVLSQNPYHDLVRFIQERGLQGKIIEKFAGLVPLMHFDTFSRGKVFLVGDSASQIKPLSYGGVYMGMRSAEILADCIVSGRYRHYSLLWKKRFGREITIALKAREIFQQLEQQELKRLFAFLKTKAKLVEQKGDFENHSAIAWELLKDPHTSKEIISILLKIIKAGFNRGERAFKSFTGKPRGCR